MFDTMLCLIGEQPVPNLLPIRALTPRKVILFSTEFTKIRSLQLESVLIEEGIPISQIEIDDPYNIAKMVPVIARQIAASTPPVLLNLTGGTKPMAFAGLEATRKHGSSFCYLQSQDESKLWLYKWENDTLALKDVRKIQEDLIKIQDYLRIHMGDYTQTDFGDSFEASVCKVLKPHVSEIAHSIRRGGSLEIDLVVRCGNRVGIAEVKTGKSAKSKAGLDQLNAACARELLGHTNKFLVVDREYPPNNKALAMARNINVVELTESSDKGKVVSADKDKLIAAVVNTLKRVN